MTTQYGMTDADMLERPTVYREGLGEFAYLNGLSLDPLLRFEASESDPGRAEPAVTGAPPRIVVPLGGGKDSLVSVDLLARAGQRFRTIAVGSSPLIEAVASEVGRVHGTGHVAIRRRLDPALFALNERGAYNGHVPITAILAAVLAVGAAFYDYDTIVLSNERSADAPTRTGDDGRDVNHQYSKSLAFERDLGAILETEAPGVSYFSLLRPWSELAITRHFARLAEFHDCFSSCNRNFRLQGGARERWCRDCPKCRFVYLALAPFIGRERLVSIFGGDLLDDPRQIAGFAALLEIDADKPFECVGEVAEARAAFGAIADRSGWRGCAVVEALRGRVPDEPLDPWLRPSSTHRIPEVFIDVALGCTGA